MNTELYIARKIFFKNKKDKTLTRPIVKIAVIGVALSLIVMILAISVMTGFKSEISSKIFDFESHIQLVKYDPNRSFESSSVNHPVSYLNDIRNVNNVKYVQSFATKAGVIKSGDQIQGAVIKGIGCDYNYSDFSKYITQGSLPLIDSVERSYKVAISESIANKLLLKIGDEFYMYFVQDPPRSRKFTICGLFKTDFPEYDNSFIIGDIKNIQRLNGWENGQVGGYEIKVNDISKLEETTDDIQNIVALNFNEETDPLRVQGLVDVKAGIFDWLNFQDMNVAFILGIMIVVACFNMISGLLIIILERTNMIGILKALGANNLNVRKIFLYQGGFILMRGLLWGNVIGLLVSFSQKYFKLFKLNAESYFLSAVPIKIDIVDIIHLNIATVAITFIVLLFTSFVIANISPVDSIKFE